jgi:hypothetical protein
MMRLEWKWYWFLTVMVIALLAGCQQQGTKEVKASINECLIFGQGIANMERAKGNISNADKIEKVVKEVRVVVDANDIRLDCPKLQAKAELAYEWVSENYPTTLYPTLIALLQERLSLYCAGETVK